MAGSPTVRLPSDPLHPDHEMYQRLLSGVQDLQRWSPEQSANLAAALYAEIHSRQPHMQVHVGGAALYDALQQIVEVHG